MIATMHRGVTLKAGDRIEEIEGVRDAVGCDVRSLSEHTLVHFFRPSTQNRLNHWCPLVFDSSYSDEPVLDGSRLVGDVLHTTDGGVAQYSGGSTFQLILDNAVEALRIPAGPKVIQRTTKATTSIFKRLTPIPPTPGEKGEKGDKIEKGEQGRKR